MKKKELNRNSSTKDLLEFATSWGYGDPDGMDASPSWMSQELQERAFEKHNKNKIKNYEKRYNYK